VIFSDERFSMQNPVLFEGDAGRLYLLHTRQDAGELGVMQQTSDVLQWWSDDDGASWAMCHEPVFARGFGAFVRGPVVSVGSDELLLPMYFTPNGEFDHRGQRSCCVRSLDGGATWAVNAQAEIRGTLRGIGIQPIVVRCGAADDGPTRLVALMRARPEPNARIMHSESTDEGLTWSAAQRTALPSNNSSIAALTLPDGRLVVAFNNATWTERFPLSLAVSGDGGATFDRIVDIVSHQIQGGALPGPVKSPYKKMWWGEHSYPSMHFDADSRELNIAYTHCRQTIAFVRIKLAFLDEAPNHSCGFWQPQPKPITAL
jgi:predicted neuraminidase